MTCKEEWDYQRRRKWVSACSIVILIALLAVLTVVVGKPLVGMVSEPQQFRQWVEERGFGGKAAFVGMVALQVVIAMIPGEPLEMAAGYAFGAWEGLLLCLIGAAIGSMLVFLFVRLCGVRLAEAFVSREKIDSIKWLHNSKKRELLIFILFLLPGTPKDVMTYFVGLTDMKWYVFLGLSSVARIPSVVTSTFSGDALGMKNYVLAIIAFGVTALISLGGLLLYRMINSRVQKGQVEEGTGAVQPRDSKEKKGSGLDGTEKE